MPDSTDKLAAQSAEVILGTKPIVGFRARDVAREALKALGLAARQSRLIARTASHLVNDLAAVARGDSELEPGAKGRRFGVPRIQWTHEFCCFASASKSLGLTPPTCWCRRV